MSAPKTLPMKLAGGQTVQVPAPGFGTFTLRDTADHPETIARAIKTGFRHLDCAWEYGVSDLVGKGIKLANIPREELFLVSKFSPQFARPENVEIGLDKELEALGTDYLDLFLAHIPVAFKTVGDMKKAIMSFEASFEDRGIAVDDKSQFIPDLEHCPRRVAALNGVVGSFLPTWRAMKDLVRKGKVRAIGVSNFEIEDIKELMEGGEADDIPVSCNQIETHPWYPNSELIAFMHAHAILPVSYSPLATIRESYVDGVYGSELCQPDGISLINEPVVSAVAARNGISNAQVLHSWVAHQGVISLGRTYTDERMAQNLDVRALSGEDLKALNALKKQGTRGKSFILTLCFPPIQFGDTPFDYASAKANGAATTENEKVNGNVSVAEVPGMVQA